MTLINKKSTTFFFDVIIRAFSMTFWYLFSDFIRSATVSFIWEFEQINLSYGLIIAIILFLPQLIFIFLPSSHSFWYEIHVSWITPVNFPLCSFISSIVFIALIWDSAFVDFAGSTCIYPFLEISFPVFLVLGTFAYISSLLPWLNFFYFLWIFILRSFCKTLRGWLSE
jgi:hypothetical protein